MDMVMGILGTGCMTGGTDTLAGTMELSRISGAVPVVFPSSPSYLSSPLPVVSSGLLPEEGAEASVLGTSGAGQR